mmetsp:Transcript_109102/g.243657  ORF Transcript_109102/g.243657 Transcript_109102/m.243657 type:complete len:132 (-) Transcript_109102:97-492(-)
MASRTSSPGARIRGGLILSIAVWILTSLIAGPCDFVTGGAPAGHSSRSSLSMITRGAAKQQIEGSPLKKDSSNDRVDPSTMLFSEVALYVFFFGLLFAINGAVFYLAPPGTTFMPHMPPGFVNAQSAAGLF